MLGAPVQGPSQNAQANMQDYREWSEMFREMSSIARELSPTEQDSLKNFSLDRRYDVKQKRQVIEALKQQILTGPARRMKERSQAVQAAGSPAFLRTR